MLINYVNVLRSGLAAVCSPF